MASLRRCCAIGLTLIGTLAPCSAASAQDYPSKPISLVVPYTPGASTDLVARLYAQRYLADRGSLRGIDTEGDEAIERFDELVAGALTL